MQIIAGMYLDVHIPNVLIISVSDDQKWVHVQMPADATNSDYDFWLPYDTRVEPTQIAPANWPPVNGDIWEANGQTAWCVEDENNVIHFVTSAAILGTGKAITSDQALVLFGNALTLKYRVV